MRNRLVLVDTLGNLVKGDWVETAATEEAVREHLEHICSKMAFATQGSGAQPATALGLYVNGERRYYNPANVIWVRGEVEA